MQVNDAASTGSDSRAAAFDIVGINYLSLYVEDLKAGVEFYSWKLGTTWLTMFPSKGSHYESGNPRNAEIALQVAHPEEVDRLYATFVAAGAGKGWPPEDTQMYERMRFCYVVDPFGMTLDIYCPLTAANSA